MEGAPHTAKDQLVCLWGAPPPVYKGEEEGAGQPHGARPKGSPTRTGSRIPPFPSGIRREGRGRKEEGKGGPAPPQFGLGLGEGRPFFCSFPLSPTKAH